MVTVTGGGVRVGGRVVVRWVWLAAAEVMGRGRVGVLNRKERGGVGWREYG